MPMVLDQETYRTILESLPFGVYLVDLDRRILLWNERAEQITGYLRHEVIGRLCHDDLLQHCNQNSIVLCGATCPLAATMREGVPTEADVLLRHKDGQRVPVHIQAIPIRDAIGSIVGAAEIFDQTIPAPEAGLHPHLYTVNDSMDAATGIPDRQSTECHFSAMFEDFARDRVPFGVLSIAVDRLDEFRQSLGAKAAEMVVHVAARTLSNNLHPPDMVGRWSPDRFVVIVTNCAADTLQKVAGILRRIASLAGISWWGDRISSTISIGGTVVRTEDTVESLVSRAEEAVQNSLLSGGDSTTIL
jgi:diguanylate cyclase (GGDEF)-like protein/PAS domain S-box-containing protein